MRRRSVKTYEEYVEDYKRAQTAVDETPDGLEADAMSRRYEQLYLEQLLMEDVASDVVSETATDDVMSAISRGDFDKSPDAFYESFNASEKIEFLTPYTLEEVSEFNTFKLKGYNIGFAVKQDGDIVLVHNNSGAKGIGDILIRKAIEMGGTKLDHFDGFLTGFYRRNGFVLDTTDQWADEYAPTEWRYEEVNIEDPMTSVYAEEKECSEREYMDAKIRYVNGKPDVVYRKIV